MGILGFYKISPDMWRGKTTTRKKGDNGGSLTWQQRKPKVQYNINLTLYVIYNHDTTLLARKHSNKSYEFRYTLKKNYI